MVRLCHNVKIDSGNSDLGFRFDQIPGSVEIDIANKYYLWSVRSTGNHSITQQHTYDRMQSFLSQIDVYVLQSDFAPRGRHTWIERGPPLVGRYALITGDFKQRSHEV